MANSPIPAGFFALKSAKANNKRAIETARIREQGLLRRKRMDNGNLQLKAIQSQMKTFMDGLKGEDETKIADAIEVTRNHMLSKPMLESFVGVLAASKGLSREEIESQGPKFGAIKNLAQSMIDGFFLTIPSSSQQVGTAKGATKAAEAAVPGVAEADRAAAVAKNQIAVLQDLSSREKDPRKKAQIEARIKKLTTIVGTTGFDPSALKGPNSTEARQFRAAEAGTQVSIKLINRMRQQLAQSKTFTGFSGSIVTGISGLAGSLEQIARASGSQDEAGVRNVNSYADFFKGLNIPAARNTRAFQTNLVNLAYSFVRSLQFGTGSRVAKDDVQNAMTAIGGRSGDKNQILGSLDEIEVQIRNALSAQRAALEAGGTALPPTIVPDRESKSPAPETPPAAGDETVIEDPNSPLKGMTHAQARESAKLAIAQKPDLKNQILNRLRDSGVSTEGLE